MTAEGHAHNPIADALRPADEGGGTSLRNPFARLSDRVNPVVVRHLRQRWRSRGLPVEMGLICVAAVVIHRLVLMNGDAPAAERGLRAVAWLRQAGLVGCLIGVGGVHSGIKQEHRETEADFAVTLTAVGARRYMRGKLLAALVTAAIFWMILAPFFVAAMRAGGPPPLWIVATALMDPLLVLIFAAFIIAAASAEKHGPRGFAFRCWCSLGFMAVLFLFSGTELPVHQLMGAGGSPASHSEGAFLLERDAIAGFLMAKAVGVAILAPLAIITHVIATDMLRPIPPGLLPHGSADADEQGA